MDPISIAASAAGLYALATQLIVMANNLISEVKSRGVLLRMIAQDLGLLQAVLSELDKKMLSTESNDKDALSHVFNGCLDTLKNIESQLSSLKALFGKTLLRKIYAQAKLRSVMDEISMRRDQLEKYKSTLLIALHLRTYDDKSNAKLNQQILELRTEISQLAKRARPETTWVNPIQEYLVASSDLVQGRTLGELTHSESSGTSSSSMAISLGSNHTDQSAGSFGDQQVLQQHLDSPAFIFECNSCIRSFSSQQSLDQHLNSPAHVFKCDDCDRSFGSRQALDQHLNSSAHVFKCNQCSRSFSTQQSLDQHVNSPIHVLKRDQSNGSLGSRQSLVAPVFGCNDCDRSFGSQQALDQHLNSPAHIFECDDCDRSFGSQQALVQHFNSPAHVFKCYECNRLFSNQQALNQHFNSPRHLFDTRSVL